MPAIFNKFLQKKDARIYLHTHTHTDTHTNYDSRKDLRCIKKTDKHPSHVGSVETEMAYIPHGEKL